MKNAADYGFGFRNMVGDPYLAAMDRRKRSHDFCACGLNASGDEEDVNVNEVSELKGNAISLQAWKYLKNGLVIVGIIVVAKFIWNKMK
jgi:hypothetical protein